MQVLLVSAQEALLSRLMLRQNPLPSLEAQKRFRAKAFGTSRAAQKKVYTLSDLNAAAEVRLTRPCLLAAHHHAYLYTDHHNINQR